MDDEGSAGPAPDPAARMQAISGPAAADIDVTDSVSESDTWRTIDVPFGTGYPYSYGHACISGMLDELRQFEADWFVVVTDDTVVGLHGHRVITQLERIAPTTVLSGVPGEASKRPDVVHDYLERAIEAGATRSSIVVGLGGGVPGNLAGMVAGLLFRGVRLVHIPTTTVAAMDSVLSLKQAVNSSRGKNSVGLYKKPEAVYVDIEMLTTLPDRDLRSGLCEFAKNALAIEPGVLPRLRDVLRTGNLTSIAFLLWMVEASLDAKLAAMRLDHLEQGAGLVLEYGHTLGHALEICDVRRRGAGAISHGEAVALGMLGAGRISATLGLLPADDLAMHEEMTTLLGVRGRRPRDVSDAEIVEAVRSDNKRGYLTVPAHQAPFVLLSALGCPLGPTERPLVTVDLDIVAEIVAELDAE